MWPERLRRRQPDPGQPSGPPPRLPHEEASPTVLVAPAESFALAALAAMPDVAVLVLDRNLRILLAEGGALHRAGWSPELIVGRCLEDLLPLEAYAELAPRYRAATEGRHQKFTYFAPENGHEHRVEALPLSGDWLPARALVLIRERLADEDF